MKVTLSIAITPEDAIVYHRAGMMPSGITAAVVRALEHLGPLEWWRIEQDWEADLAAWKRRREGAK